MPPKEENKTFPSETLSLLVAALMKSAGKATLPVDFKIMSALSNGEFTATALEHKFRGPRARAREILDAAKAVEDAGGELAAVPSPAKKKRG